MNPRASVTLTMREYQELSNGISGGGVAFIAIAAFGVGMVVGMQTLDDPAPAKQPPAVVQPGEPARSLITTSGAVTVRI